MLTFKPLSTLKRGDIYQMLCDSYHDLALKYDASHKQQYLHSWRSNDDLAFDYLDTVGKCIFVSYLDDQLVGFTSFDPRHFPDYGVVGQNCVLTKFKGQGFGKQQLSYLLSYFTSQGCRQAIVSTGESDFFIPAQRMYLAVGFVEKSRVMNETYGYREINYVKSL